MTAWPAGGIIGKGNVARRTTSRAEPALAEMRVVRRAFGLDKGDDAMMGTKVIRTLVILAVLLVAAAARHEIPQRAESYALVRCN